jgi:sensor histidine kinase YesM
LHILLQDIEDTMTYLISILLSILGIITHIPSQAQAQPARPAPVQQAVTPPVVERLRREQNEMQAEVEQLHEQNERIEERERQQRLERECEERIAAEPEQRAEGHRSNECSEVR